MKPDTRRAITLLRIAAAVVVVTALGMVAWLVHTAAQNPEVRAKRPSWVSGVFDVPYWLPLIATVGVGAACVVYVYVRAARRLRDGEDIVGNSFRERQRRGEVGREQL